jgi:hypothetical protein
VTAAVAEAGQDTGEAPQDPEAHLRALADALAETDRCIRQLVADELGELWPALDQAEEQAAGNLRAAVEALEAPQAAINALSAEITRVEGQCSDWQSRLESDRIEDRVEARVRFQAWDDELDKLRQKRDFAEAEMLPLLAARTKCRGDMELAQGAKRGLAWAMIDPFGTAVGQGTRAYVAHRQVRLNHVLLAADRANPEWDCAVSELRELCMAVMRAGHDITADLPAFGELAFRSMTSAMTDASSAWGDPAPSAADVVAKDRVTVENAALAATRSKIEDHRNTRPVPRNAPVREFMKPPATVREMGLR